MKIVGLGMGKTGTTTLKIMLERLGYKVHDGGIELVKPTVEKDLDTIFKVVDEYDAFEDEPWNMLYKEIDRQYPGSKFILTYRKTPEKWLKSLINHSTNTGYRGKADCVYYHQMLYGYPYVVTHEKEFLDIYNSHIAEAKEYFKYRPEDFIEICFENGDGWDKLCKFVDKPIPQDTSIPHEKKADYELYNKMIRMARKYPERMYPTFEEVKQYLRL
jgi:hypothetical protein